MDKMSYRFITSVRGITMVKSKELSEAFRKKIVDAYVSGKGYENISKEFVISHSIVKKIIYKRRTFKTTANMARSGHPSKFTTRADRKTLKGVSKNPKMSSRDLQQAFATVYAKVHESTIRKRLHNFNYYNLCCLKKHEGKTEVSQRTQRQRPRPFE
ncbi:hypothetical protein QTP70_026114 [Hemibagrus guttatus]|uniref:Transposase Tc1-like domain-containing protein n=1 Tax=Hemibagrus guttatus TaxID=175788 RepID=A0AAE0RKT9_9TELE|nr:hypothetical protein QTP70_026114 [Hemibagrus guttatus]